MANILITGVTGYIGNRLLELLSHRKHNLYCTVRDKKRFESQNINSSNLLEVDFLKTETLQKIPKQIDVVYYLMHSMSSGNKNFDDLETKVAQNFVDALKKTEVKQVIYLTGMINEKELSQHLSSRKKVEEILATGAFHLTTLRAGIIIGSGSASFEIIRDLVEKLPIMVAPRWIKTRCQPIAIRDVLNILEKVILNTDTFDKNYDIAGLDTLTYKEMLLTFAKCRKLKRHIFTVPVLTPRLSSYWLYFVTSVSYPLAKTLVDSMSIDFIARDHSLIEQLNLHPIDYATSIQLAFDKIKQNSVISSWRDTCSRGNIEPHLEQYITVPIKGCFKDVKRQKVKNKDRCINHLWEIGGENGWYYANQLWKVRGWIDKAAGGVGLNRSRRLTTTLRSGDALDFWRVIIANKKEGRLLLYAEMKLPGEAWLEFTFNKKELIQTATFRPHGVKGRLYWYLLYPFHHFIFKGMLKSIVNS